MIAIVVYPVIVGAILAVIGAAIAWQAWVLAVLWAWFAVPIGAPALGVAHAVGVILMVAAVRGRDKVRSDPSDTRSGLRITGEVLVFIAVRPAVLLAAGWVAKGFM